MKNYRDYDNNVYLHTGKEVDGIYHVNKKKKMDFTQKYVKRGHYIFKTNSL